MNVLARGSLCALMFFLSSCGTLEITVEGPSTPDLITTGTVGYLQTQNADLATRIAEVTPSTGATLPAAVTAPAHTALPPTVPVPVATRITFLNGASVGVVSAPIAAGQTQNYVLDAFEQQPMFV